MFCLMMKQKVTIIIGEIATIDYLSDKANKSSTAKPHNHWNSIIKRRGHNSFYDMILKEYCAVALILSCLVWALRNDTNDLVYMIRSDAQ